MKVWVKCSRCDRRIPFIRGRNENLNAERAERVFRRLLEHHEERHGYNFDPKKW